MVSNTNLRPYIAGSYEEVIDDVDVDAVYIPLPTMLHVVGRCKLSTLD